MTLQNGSTLYNYNFQEFLGELVWHCRDANKRDPQKKPMVTTRHRAGLE